MEKNKYEPVSTIKIFRTLFSAWFKLLQVLLQRFDLYDMLKSVFPKRVEFFAELEEACSSYGELGSVDFVFMLN